MNVSNEPHDSLPQDLLAMQKKMFQFVLIWTCIYIVLFPLIFWMALWSALVFDSPGMSISIGLTIIGATFCIPLSMMVSVWKMWSYYFRDEHNKIYRILALPLWAFLFAVIVNIFLKVVILGK